MIWNPFKYFSQLFVNMSADDGYRLPIQDQAQKTFSLAQDINSYINARFGFLDDGNTLIVRLGQSCPTGWVEATAFRDTFLRGPDTAGGPSGAGVQIGTRGGTASPEYYWNGGAGGDVVVQAYTSGSAVGVPSLTAIYTPMTAVSANPVFQRVLFCQKASL